MTVLTDIVRRLVRLPKPETNREILMRAYPEHYALIMKYAEPYWACYPRFFDLVPDDPDPGRVLGGLFSFWDTAEGFEFWAKLRTQKGDWS